MTTSARSKNSFISHNLFSFVSGSCSCIDNSLNRLPKQRMCQRLQETRLRISRMKFRIYNCGFDQNGKKGAVCRKSLRRLHKKVHGNPHCVGSSRGSVAHIVGRFESRISSVLKLPDVCVVTSCELCYDGGQ